MHQSAKKLLLIVLLMVGCCLAARADYESQRWAVGKYPHRIGIIGINDEVTKTCLGEEHGWKDGAIGPYYLNIHPYLFFAIVSIPAVVMFAFIYGRGYRHRHESAA